MSADDEECICPEPEPGIPGWMPTFADLMSLLMCFFVLLLSFSEMDALKFKRLAGSMREAFGVQNKLNVKDIPKGTSIIAQEFSPGRPQPTPIKEIWQKTDDQQTMTLDVQCKVGDDEARESGQPDSDSAKSDLLEKLQGMIKETEQDAVDLANAMRDEIARGEVEIETHGRDITVRIKEKGSFASGSATLARKYVKVLKSLQGVLVDKPGVIAVQGHTDNVPIRTSRFRSNWELSSARAVSVAHALLSGGKLNPGRFVVTGYAETRPLAENKSNKTRARNRRVEIVLKQGFDAQTQAQVNLLKNSDPNLYKSLELTEAPAFELKPDEIF
ncbi:MAG: flagellar motor protein MotB [Pseudomonadales bacterium]